MILRLSPTALWWQRRRWRGSAPTGAGRCERRGRDMFAQAYRSHVGEKLRGKTRHRRDVKTTASAMDWGQHGGGSAGGRKLAVPMRRVGVKKALGR